MALQHWISLVLAMGMIETTLLFVHYLNWNDYGTPAVGMTVLALIFGVIKRSMSRIVVLLVSLGYGVVRPTLGEEMHKVLGLGGAYFVLSLFYTISMAFPYQNKRADDDSFIDLLSIVTVLIAVIDSIFYIWIITAINNVLMGLAIKKQAMKYILYRNFRLLLFFSILTTCMWILYGSIIALDEGTGEDSNWQVNFIIICCDFCGIIFGL